MRMQNRDRRTSKPIDISPLVSSIDLNSIDVLAPNTQRATLALCSAQRTPADKRFQLSTIDYRLSTRARAFSLVEILTVIGIIAILITLAVVGFKVVGKAAREKVTNNQLENCKSLVNEYELTSTIDTLPCRPSTSPVRWNAPAVGNSTILTCTATAQPPANDAKPNERYLRDETAVVIARLRAVPNNRASLEKMAADHIVKVRFPTDPSQAVSTTTEPPDYAAATPTLTDGVNLLDGWGNPIILVPGGGLTNVYRGYDGKGDPTLAASYSDSTTPVKSPDGRPFWVSPGPDGNIQTGDDNVYSFGN